MFCLLHWSLNKWVYFSHTLMVVLGSLQPWRGILLLPWVWSILVPQQNWSHRNRHLSSRQPHLTISKCLCLLFSLTDKSACPSHDQISLAQRIWFLSTISVVDDPPIYIYELGKLEEYKNIKNNTANPTLVSEAKTKFPHCNVHKTGS